MPEKGPKPTNPPAWQEGTERLRIKGALRHLLDRAGSVERYELDIDDGTLTEELYAKFGVYDSVAVASAYDKLLKYPSLLKNPTLKEIAAKAKANDGFDYSFVASATRSIDPALLLLERKAEALNAASNTHQRKKLLRELRADVASVAALRKLETSSRGNHEPLTVRELEYDPFVMVWSQQGSSINLRKVGEAIQKADFVLKFEKSVGALDRTRLEANTLTYGAKGANLDELKSLENALRHFRLGLTFQVPDYEKIPASVYDSWKQGGRILEEATRIHGWIKGRKAILRSSTVYSEDSENATGAGIYDSIVIEKGASVRDVFMAMKKVYESVDSAQAIAYRAEHGIPKESMGLVVQEFVDTAAGDRGTVNTVVKNVPELMEIVYADGLRPLINKESTLDAVIGGNDSGIFHYELDLRRKNTHEVKDLAALAILLERHYGQAIQLEFVQRNEGRYSLNETYLVQARFLPKSFSEKKHIEFPDEKPLFEGRAVGVFDVTLPVLPNRADNSQENGVVLFDSTKFFSMSNTFGVKNPLPETGGVVVFRGSREGGGHIETICAEKGLALVFSDEGAEISNAHMEIFKMRMGVKEGIRVEHTHLDGYKTIRLVSDGLVGKVYGVGEPEHSLIESDTDSDEWWNRDPKGL